MRIERRPWLAAQPRKRAISWRKIPLLDSRGSEWWIVLSEGGVPKRPVSQAIIARLGIEGDACAHPQHHGGPEKAILLIASETIDLLRKRGYAVYPGALGENITTEGVDPRALRPGQRYRIGGALLELTRLRVPAEPSKCMARVSGGRSTTGRSSQATLGRRSGGLAAFTPPCSKAAGSARATRLSSSGSPPERTVFAGRQRAAIRI
ncbi:MAG: MOSC domain-containing protein [Acidobacteria bacterium]|nr:MOSC domain-containing protein [Acidobacteriota bacterium]